MAQKTRDLIASAAVLAFAALYFAGSFTIRITDRYGGSALIPRICSGILALCALTLLWRTLRGKRSAEEEPQEKAREVPSNYLQVFLTLLLIAAYAFLLKILGFIPSTFLYLIAQIVLLMPKRGLRRILGAAAVSVAVALLVYLLFVKVFFVTLPAGTIW